VLAPPASAAKVSECKDVHTTVPPLLREPPAEAVGLAAGETSMLHIALASGHGRTITRNDVCGLLTECL
jgi:hypothetical protein